MVARTNFSTNVEKFAFVGGCTGGTGAGFTSAEVGMV
jgi:hypothetical protein